MTLLRWPASRKTGLNQWLRSARVSIDPAFITKMVITGFSSGLIPDIRVWRGSDFECGVFLRWFIRSINKVFGEVNVSNVVIIWPGFVVLRKVQSPLGYSYDDVIAQAKVYMGIQDEGLFRSWARFMLFKHGVING
ncbi:hypothetical protein KN1_23810 [Stygiolobus caldivivus]|uniref:Uncharacterized protein n=1 Tax=Stygiolobus caldivivus TaxID=2824673 RepID=A0A8D5ZJ13_9CREN|nr:hypothetical protein KN1_23810 [Stygiolobus caldivivus]